MITDLVEERDGWLWPRADRRAFPWLTKQEADLPEHICRHVTHFRTCIQAGGNCGLYAADYAQWFDTVHTWEPEAVNFYCLAANAPYDNVFAHRTALGSAPGVVALGGFADNAGAHFVDRSKRGLIRMMTIDSYGLADVDLIHLDVEGYEGEVLTGARETITRCRPVIACEMMGHGGKFGWPDRKVEEFVCSFGYERAEAYKHDVIWRPL